LWTTVTDVENNAADHNIIRFRRYAEKYYWDVYINLSFPAMEVCPLD
jgi:hypothetical protein